MLPKPLKQFLSRGAKNAVDLVDLVQLIRPWKQWEEANYFEEYAADTPDVHLVVIVTVCQQTLWRSVPARRDILSVGLLAIDAATRAKVSEFQHVVRNEDVLLKRTGHPQRNALDSWLSVALRSLRTGLMSR